MIFKRTYKVTMARPTIMGAQSPEVKVVIVKACSKHNAGFKAIIETSGIWNLKEVERV